MAKVLAVILAVILALTVVTGLFLVTPALLALLISFIWGISFIKAFWIALLAVIILQLIL